MSCGCNSSNPTNLNPINYKPDNEFGTNGASVQWLNIIGIPSCIQDCTTLVNFISSTFTTIIPETDPTVPAHVKVITPTQISNWDTAFSWGNHAGLYVPLARTVTAGTGLTGGGQLNANITISHDDTSSVSNIDTSAAQVVDTMTFDTFGHVTAVTLRNLTPADIGAQPAGGPVATPTLLQVTTAGATTNINTTFTSTVQVDRLNILATIGNIRSNAGMEIQSGVGQDLRLNAASSQNILFLNNNITTNTVFNDGRISGTAAINPNEFVTLAQATALAGTGSFIQNQSLSVQTGTFRISGAGEFNGAVLTGGGNGILTYTPNSLGNVVFNLRPLGTTGTAELKLAAGDITNSNYTEFQIRNLYSSVLFQQFPSGTGTFGEIAFVKNATKSFRLTHQETIPKVILNNDTLTASTAATLDVNNTGGVATDIVLRARYLGGSVFTVNGNGAGAFTSTVSGADATASNQFVTLSQADGRYIGATTAQFVAVRSIADLPAPVAGVRTLAANTEYLFITNINLGTDRLVFSNNTAIRGIGAGIVNITSTLGAGVALITATTQTAIRDVSLSVSGAGAQCINFAGSGVELVLIQGVIFGTGKVGTFNTANTVIFQNCALNGITDGVTFNGTIASVVFDTTTIASPILAATIINVLSTCTITNRIRIVYSTFNIPSGTTGLNVSVSATIPAESYLVAYCNFTGSGTYLTGVLPTDNKATFSHNKGISNSSATGAYYMNNNATATTIGAINTFVKAAGVTTAGAINERFTHIANNRSQYTGAVTRRFKVTVGLGVQSTASNAIIARLAVNGTTDATSEIRATTNGAGDPTNLFLQGIYNLNTNDYVEVFVANGTAANNITARDLNFVIQEID